MLRGFLVVIIAMFLFVSCSKEAKKEEPKAAAPGTGEVIDKYVNTLTTAKPKAESAAEAANTRVQEQDRMLKELEK